MHARHGGQPPCTAAQYAVPRSGEPNSSALSVMVNSIRSSCTILRCCSSHTVTSPDCTSLTIRSAPGNSCRVKNSSSRKTASARARRLGCFFNHACLPEALLHERQSTSRLARPGQRLLCKARAAAMMRRRRRHLAPRWRCWKETISPSVRVAQVHAGWCTYAAAACRG